MTSYKKSIEAQTVDRDRFANHLAPIYTERLKLEINCFEWQIKMAC